MVLAVGVAATATMAFAEEVGFFSDGIDYWKEGAAPAQPAPKSPEPPKEAQPRNEPTLEVAKPKAAESEKFDWRPYLDAKNKEFFREGDYTPPEPFMEILRDPSDANLRMWFAYIERKNALTQRLAARMDEYVRRNGGSMSQQEKARVEAVASQLPRVSPHDYRALRFRMYFDSTCPHCKRMFETLNELQRRGYFVEARQTDSAPTQHLRSEVPIMAASRDELKKFGVNSVPLILAGDLKAGRVYRLSGYRTVDELLGQLGAKAGVATP